jgi:hypothetical protein
MMRIPVLLTTCAIAMGATAACSRAADPAEWTLTVQRVAAPSGANSSEPQFVESPGGLVLSWVERVGKTTTLKFAERGGSGWSSPITAASGDDWFLSYADVPSVMKLSNGTYVAQWLQQVDPFLEAYNLRIAYSKDGGKTWSASFLPHNDNTRTQHGFASFVELPGSTAGVVWLDGRNSEFDAGDPATGTMTLRYAAFDSNWKQTADVEIDRKVCECCPTAIAATADGIITAFRDRSDTEVRDIAVSRLENGKWTTPAAVFNDNWQLDLCPVNGPMLSARGRNVAAAWFTVKNDLGQAYAAFSSDAGRTWSAPIRIDDRGSLGRVDIDLLEDGSALASWVEYAEGAADFRVRRIERSGAKSGPINVAPVSGGRASGYPRMAVEGDSVVFAWTDSDDATGQLQMMTAVGQLP